MLASPRASSWLVTPAHLVAYSDGYEAMHSLAERRGRGEVPDTLILLEHPPVYTAGRRSDPSHILWAEDRMRGAGAELHFVDRGGSVTFHGPGQLVGYPILDLGSTPDVIAYLRRGVQVHRDPAATGVWSGRKKVCAIGVKLLQARVTLHGFALNCTTDLGWFDAIVPCGLADRSVTTLSQLADRSITVDEMRPLVARHFGELFGMEFDEQRLEPWMATDVVAAR